MSLPSQIFRYSGSSETADTYDNLYLKLMIFTLIFAWTSGIFIKNMILHIDGFIFLLPILDNSYSLVCHQDPEKLFTFAGIDALVCSRCAGIYIGFFALSFSMFVKSIKIDVPFKLFIFSALLTMTDVFMVLFGILPYSKIRAFITGFLLGSLGFLYFYRGLQNLLIEIKTGSVN